ncbi:unnamed protein product [Rhizoctonia solani]|uniref:SAP domain-containing protein n=1 Tax=Rhizoctonia solani TaxID=456999 RepID=A0A8H3GNX3_9AGAM|nr:unnamed protein product [Rhizoctonia solani]
MVREQDTRAEDPGDDTEHAGTSAQATTEGSTPLEQSLYFSQYTVEILKGLCRKHKLVLSGAKRQLIDRLVDLYRSKGLPLPTHEEIEQLKIDTPAPHINGASSTLEHNNPEGSEPPAKRRRPLPKARPTGPGSDNSDVIRL